MKLETSLRRQKRLTTVLGVTLAAALSLAAAAKLADIDGSSFRLLDKQGKVRATLAGDEAGNPTLTFLTPEGIATRALGMHDDLPGRVAELERVIGGMERAQVLLGGGGAVLVPDGVTQSRLSEVERQTDRTQAELADQRRLNAQAQDQLRMDQDLRRREQERWDLQRRIDRAKP